MIKLLETPEETTTKMPCLTGLDCCLSEDKRNCHTYGTSIMTITFKMFLNKDNIIGCYFSICAISFVAFVCILYWVISACCVGMFVWLYQILNVYVVFDECNAFLVLCDALYLKDNTFSSEVFVLSDVRLFRNLAF